MIYLDVTNACKTAQNTGIQRMTRKIFAELSKRTAVHPLCANNVGKFYHELGERERQFLINPFQVRSRATARPEWSGHGPLAEYLRRFSRSPLRLEDKITDDDVFLVPDIYRDNRREILPDFLRKTSARTVAIFHDATDLRLTSIYPTRGIKSRPYLESLSLFDLVICVSEEARTDLLHFWKEYGCPPTETQVESWPGEFERTAPASSASAPGNLIIYVSSLDARKNHVTLLRAAEKLWSEGLSFRLHLIGRAGRVANKSIRQLWKMQMHGRPVRWLRHVNEETLLRAYRDCRFTVYPSLMEGFGLPIVESLQHGKPCICGGNGALGEVARGGGCLMVDQTNEDSLADGMKKLLTDQTVYMQLCAEARARKFRSWADYTERLLKHLVVSNPT